MSTKKPSKHLEKRLATTLWTWPSDENWSSHIKQLLRLPQACPHTRKTFNSQSRIGEIIWRNTDHRSWETVCQAGYNAESAAWKKLVIADSSRRTPWQTQQSLSRCKCCLEIQEAILDTKPSHRTWSSCQPARTHPPFQWKHRWCPSQQRRNVRWMQTATRPEGQ